MCNINVIQMKTKKYQNILSLLNAITWNSFNHNNDGEGFIALTNNNNVYMGRNNEKIIYKNKNFKTILTHQRKSSSGFGFNNIHPIETKRFLMLHNGIIDNNSDFEKSDSKIYLETFEKKYQGDIIQTIKNMSNKYMGSYSIVLFDKITKNIYYYKNFMTSMYFIDTKDILLMSTNYNNMEYACSILHINPDLIQKVENNIIYQINNGLKKINKIEYKDNTGRIVKIFDKITDICFAPLTIWFPPKK